MQIFINGEIIDFTLENEKTLGDVVHAVSGWLNSNNYVLETLKIDNMLVAISDSDWRIKPVDSVKKLDISATDCDDGPVNQLTYLQEYLYMLKNITDVQDTDNLRHIAEGYGDFRLLLSQFINLAPTSSMTTLDNAIECILKGMMIQDNNKLDNEINVILNILEECSNEVLNPMHYAIKYARALAGITGKFEDTAVALQTGKDAQAMETILYLTELLQSFSRCISWSKNNYTLEDIKRLLDELEESLRTGDTVLTGDLLEYELKPVLLELPQKLETIAKLQSAPSREG